MEATIIELNNMAVTGIDANKFKEAISSLTRALQLTKNQFCMMNPPSSSHQPCLEGSMHHSETSQSPGAPCSHHQDMVMPAIVAANNDHGITERRPLFKYSSELKYQHPFTIFPEMDHAIQSSPSSLSGAYAESQTSQVIGLSAIIIFNMGLCFDLLASKSSTTKQNVFIPKAISLYEKVVELYLQGRSDCMEDDTTTAREGNQRGMGLRAQQNVVVMAAVNNLIQLHSESSQQEKYIHFMMALLQEIQRTDYGSDEIQTHVHSQARVFMSNMVVMSSDMRLLSISAAAA